MTNQFIQNIVNEIKPQKREQLENKQLLNTEKVKSMKIGDKILLEDCVDLPDYNGRIGVVHYIDDYGFMTGTWGKEVINERIDSLKKIGEEKVSLKEILLAEMGSKQSEVKARFDSLIQEGIRHLIKIYYFRNNEQHMIYDKKKWIATVHRNISCNVRNSKGKLCLTIPIADEIISDNLSEKKFHGYFEDVLEDYENSVFIPQKHSEEEQKAKVFVLEYLNWAKELLLEQPVIPTEIVTKKIEEMIAKWRTTK